MGQPLSFEDSSTYFFITIRTIESRLWFINNPALTKKIVSFVARNQNKFGVELYAFVLMGNHYHLIARFPRANRAGFTKALDSIIALLTRSHVLDCPEGGTWSTSAVQLPLLTEDDVLDKFLYCALNPVSSGIVQRISDYPNYNSVGDAISGRTTHHTVFLRANYNKRLRQNPRIKKKDFVKHHTLTYSRLPGFEQMTQHGYQRHMLALIEKRRQEVVQQRLALGKSFGTPALILATEIGAKPKTTKKSPRNSRRPLALSRCPEALRIFLEWYRELVRAFREASERYRAGELNVVFPPGTYRPPVCTSPP